MMKSCQNGDSVFYKYSNKGDMESHQFMIYGIVRGIKPKSILEIGVRSGVSTKVICQALEDGGIGCDYTCCDMNSACKKVQKVTKILLDFKVMTSDELVKSWDKELGLLFIDGCHEYSQVRRDYLNFGKFVVPNGFIFFHDTCPPSDKYKTPNYCWNAYKILEDLKKDKSIEFVTFPYSYGLTVCRKI